MNPVSPASSVAIAALALTALLSPLPAVALEEEILVTATRVERDPLTTPFAISTVDKDDVQRRQLLGLDESLSRVPGLYFSNRYNYSRDLRISIRGFGARSNFGVRGLRVYIDGIPSTAPDGQTALDDLDLSNVERVEVIRGPASALYGASAGGVINIFTEEGPETPFAEGGFSFGEYEFNRYLFKAGGQHGQLNYYLNGSYLNFDGYRDHSNVEQGNVNGKFSYTFGDGSVGRIILRAVDSPEAEDAGGLLASEVMADRRAARDRNVALDAGESVDERKLGLSWRKQWGVHTLDLRNYYIWRDFDAKLPLPPFAGTGIVQFDREFFGGGAQYSNVTPLFGRDNRVTLGVDVDSQDDDRQRFDNLNGARGPLQFDQDEEADTVGVYLQDEFQLTEQVGVQAALRYDSIDFEIDDRFLANGDQSAKLEFDEINWMIGAVYSHTPALNLYGNYATAFETPTFTEFANPAQNGTLGGFANVAPQRTRGFEVGLKGLVAERVRYELAYYDMNVEDEVTAVANVGGRAFFRNADTDRRGVELGVVAELLAGLDFTATYTYSDFEFDRFTSNPPAEGQTLPGVPEHYAFFELDYRHDSGFWAKWDLAHVGSIYADNLNTTEVDSYEVSNLFIGWDFKLDRLTFSPNLGIANLFDENYNQEIRIQAFGGRYFEPAPDRNVFGGLRVRYDFDG
ncbi:MAG: TonB-dependent receptor family protein [Gammaproteobacteria bacterium]